MVVVREMVMAIIDANAWLGHGVKCAEEEKRFLLAFADLVKRAKNAAGMFCCFLLLNMKGS